MHGRPLAQAGPPRHGRRAGACHRRVSTTGDERPVIHEQDRTAVTRPSSANRSPLAVSVVRLGGEIVGACDHLRLTGPFSWLEQHEGWAPLDFAVKPGAPD